MQFSIKDLLRDKTSIYLLLILLLAAVLRFYGLTNQSLWLDELHTMNEADPSISWSEMFNYLKCCDQHPPLFFIIERILFSLFGHTEGVARGLAAACGFASVFAMYLLGKELSDKKLGLIAALLTSVNYFNIFYSQEARCYIMAMLFAVLSYLYFIRLIKDFSGKKNALLYSLFTLLMMYSHYYSLFIVASQGIVVIILWLGKKEDKLKFLKAFSLSGVLILIGYLPWIPFVIEMSKIHSFWISPIQGNFATSYFYDYFGNNELINPFLVFLLIYFCWQVVTQENFSIDKIKDSPLLLTFLVFFIGVFVTYLVPYLRSVLVVPMLFNRYTIVVLPAFIIALAFSFSLIKNRVASAVLLSIFIGLTLIDTNVVKKFYSELNIRKTQFREMTKFISEDVNYIYPVIEERTSWQHQYYLKRYNYNAPVLAGNKEALVDSILSAKSKTYNLQGFWIVGAHGGESHLSTERKQKLRQKFELIKEKEFYDAWAELYINKTQVIDAVQYLQGVGSYMNETCVPLWAGSVASQPFTLPPGHYEMVITHLGTKAQNVFPHIVVYVNDKVIGEFDTENSWKQSKFPLEAPDKDVILKLDFVNDLMTSGEDRNAFVKSIYFEKK